MSLLHHAMSKLYQNNDDNGNQNPPLPTLPLRALREKVNHALSKVKKDLFHRNDDDGNQKHDDDGNQKHDDGGNQKHDDDGNQKHDDDGNQMHDDDGNQNPPVPTLPLREKINIALSKVKKELFHRYDNDGNQKHDDDGNQNPPVPTLPLREKINNSLSNVKKELFHYDDDDGNQNHPVPTLPLKPPRMKRHWVVRFIVAFMVILIIVIIAAAVKASKRSDPPSRTLQTLIPFLPESSQWAILSEGTPQYQTLEWGKKEHKIVPQNLGTTYVRGNVHT